MCCSLKATHNFLCCDRPRHSASPLISVAALHTYVSKWYIIVARKSYSLMSDFRIVVFTNDDHCSAVVSLDDRKSFETMATKYEKIDIQFWTNLILGFRSRSSTNHFLSLDFLFYNIIFLSNGNIKAFMSYFIW